uniref:Serine/threonine-protein kinase n=1 Tax=Gadus morhua TaxID=8049 RepID=A0A8C5C453_GADMO
MWRLWGRQRTPLRLVKTQRCLGLRPDPGTRTDLAVVPAPLQVLTQVRLMDADFEALYEELEQLGQGGFGRVFAGYRREDRLPVRVTPQNHTPCVSTHVSDPPHPLLNSEAVSLCLCCLGRYKGPGAVVLLLDWFQLDQELLLVQERPDASVDLRAYMRSKGSTLQEQEAKMILHQVVEGIQGLHSRGVLHRDIKPDNLLVETGSDTPRVRIIDLGCGCLHNNEVYSEFNGTDLYIPPEVYSKGVYRADPMTVWQLGVLLYEMLTGNVPFQTSVHIVTRLVSSPDCKDFLKRCLTKRALGRPPLQSLLLHPWLQGAD